MSFALNYELQLFLVWVLITITEVEATIRMTPYKKFVLKEAEQEGM